jgi:hypothetical protein
MHRNAFVLAAVLAACCATAQAQWAEPALQAGVAPSSRAAQDARFREAMRLHKLGRWSAAYGRLAALADEGHAPSARVALAMLRNGPGVYGTDWTATPRQVAAWEHASGTHGTIKLAAQAE